MSLELNFLSIAQHIFYCSTVYLIAYVLFSVIPTANRAEKSNTEVIASLFIGILFVFQLLDKRAHAMIVLFFLRHNMLGGLLSTFIIPALRAFPLLFLLGIVTVLFGIIGYLLANQVPEARFRAYVQHHLELCFGKEASRRDAGFAERAVGFLRSKAATAVVNNVATFTIHNYYIFQTATLDSTNEEIGLSVAGKMRFTPPACARRNSTYNQYRQYE